jgi:hypothetical protein
VDKIEGQEKHIEYVWENLLENAHLEYRGDGKIMIKMTVRGMGCEKWMMKLAHNRLGLQ